MTERTYLRKAGIILKTEAELPFSFFQFEVTETVATEYSEMLYQAVKEFVEAGSGLCLDDFGAGYANLDTVLRLPFHCIKLDKSLLRNVCENEQAAKIIRIFFVLRPRPHRPE